MQAAKTVNLDQPPPWLARLICNRNSPLLSTIDLDDPPEWLSLLRSNHAIDLPPHLRSRTRDSQTVITSLGTDIHDFCKVQKYTALPDDSPTDSKIQSLKQYCYSQRSKIVLHDNYVNSLKESRVEVSRNLAIHLKMLKTLQTSPEEPAKHVDDDPTIQSFRSVSSFRQLSTSISDLLFTIEDSQSLSIEHRKALREASSLVDDYLNPTVEPAPSTPDAPPLAPHVTVDLTGARLDDSEVEDSSDIFSDPYMIEQFIQSMDKETVSSSTPPPSTHGGSIPVPESPSTSSDDLPRTKKSRNDDADFNPDSAMSMDDQIEDLSTAVVSPVQPVKPISKTQAKKAKAKNRLR